MRHFLSFLLFYTGLASSVTEIKVYENENIMLNCPIESLAVSWYMDSDEIIHFNPQNKLFVESDPNLVHAVTYQSKNVDQTISSKRTKANLQLIWFALLYVTFPVIVILNQMHFVTIVGKGSKVTFT